MATRLSRRSVLIAAAVAGGGLLLSLTARRGGHRRIAVDERVFEPNAYLQIRPDGGIVLQVDKLEMGQGVMTGFVTIVAEELDVRPDQIDARHAPVHALFQTPAQVTGESNSMRTRWETLRQTGALARRLLLDAAARRWNIDNADVATRGDAVVVNSLNGATLTYGELAEAAGRLPEPASPTPRSPSSFRWIGTDVPRPDVVAKVRGNAEYGIDVGAGKIPVAVIARPPRVGAVATEFDATAAERLPGVAKVFAVPAGIAVVADGYWIASQAAARLSIQWRDADARPDSRRLYNAHKELLDERAGVTARDDGDTERAFAEADLTVEAEYRFPFLAHATMEPMNATALVEASRCEIWAPTQCPDLAREAAMRVTGLSRDQVVVHQVFAGGGFGRRYLNDYVTEAVTIAAQVNGPVKLMWSREDDVRHDFLRGASLHRVRAGVAGDGNVSAWQHRLVAPGLSQYILPDGLPVVLPEWIPDRWIGAAAGLISTGMSRWMGPVQAWDGTKNMPYEFANIRADIMDWDSGIRSGIWRSVGNHYNAFVVETFVDELAAATNTDPISFRMQHLSGSERHRRVLEILRSESGWSESSDGVFRGVAVHGCYGSVVGQVAEVDVEDDKSFSVRRVICVVDCGTPINPDIIRAQMEGGIVFGLTAALYGRIDIDDGAVRQSNFHDYRMLTLAETPRIDVHIVPSDEPPGGVGEAAVPTIAPAVANALFAATGQRLREMPLRLAAA